MPCHAPSRIYSSTSTDRLTSCTLHYIHDVFVHTRAREPSHRPACFRARIVACTRRDSNIPCHGQPVMRQIEPRAAIKTHWMPRSCKLPLARCQRNTSPRYLACTCTTEGLIGAVQRASATNSWKLHSFLSRASSRLPLDRRWM